MKKKKEREPKKKPKTNQAEFDLLLGRRLANHTYQCAAAGTNIENAFDEVLSFDQVLSRLALFCKSRSALLTGCYITGCVRGGESRGGSS